MTDYALTRGQIEYMKNLEKESQSLHSNHGNDVEKWGERLYDILTISQDATHLHGSFRDTAQIEMERIGVPTKIRSSVYENYKTRYWNDETD